MKDDKFRKISDENMNKVSGGAYYTVEKNTKNIFRKYEIKDQDGNVCKKCFTERGAEQNATYMNTQHTNEMLTSFLEAQKHNSDKK